MSGAGRKTFTAGEVLTAADVNSYFMDQAVMNFAGTAARASAIPSPTEGMVTHIGGGTVEVYTGSQWSDISASPISDSGLILIDEESFSAVSSVSLNNVFSATYENYRVIFRSTGSTSNRAIFRLRSSGSDATTGYAGRLLTADGTGVAGGTISATLFPLINDNTSSVAYAAIDVMQPHETTITGFLSVGSTSNPDIRFIGGRNINATSYDGSSLVADSTGNITGTVRVYGYKGA